MKAVPDILSQGGGRESGPWPRRVAAAAVLVLVAVTIVHYLPRSRHETARPVRVPVTVTPPPAVSGAVSGDAGVAEEPDGITGQVLSWPGGLRLPATGPRPAWFWPATGQVVPIGGLPLQRSGYQRTAAGMAREVSIAGRPLGPRLRLPAGYLIRQGTGRGLLLAPVAQQTGTMADKLWDPAAPQAGRSFDGVIAVSATRIAWAPPCVARCRVQVLNLATGRQVSAGLPRASSVASAAFSPDSGSLVVQVNFSDEAAYGAQPVQLELVSLASGRLTAVPQTWVSSDALVGFGWPASSDSLVAEFGFTAKVQLASWRPGASRLAIAVLRPRHSPASLVIGPAGLLP